MSPTLIQRLAAAVLALLTLGGSSFARSQTMSMPAYMGLSVGRATTDIDCSGALSCDRSDAGWKLFGGYLFHPNFGVEVDVRDHGKATLSGLVAGVSEAGRLSTESVGLYGLATARESALSGFAKLGLAATRARGSDAVSALATPDRETHVRPAIGLGLAWDFTQRISARLEFERVRVKFGGAHRDVDLFSAGVQTRF